MPDQDLSDHRVAMDPVAQSLAESGVNHSRPPSVLDDQDLDLGDSRSSDSGTADRLQGSTHSTQTSGVHDEGHQRQLVPYALPSSSNSGSQMFLASVPEPSLKDFQQCNFDPEASRAIFNEKMNQLDSTVADLKKFLHERAAFEMHYDEMFQQLSTQKSSFLSFKSDLVKASDKADSYYAERFRLLEQKVQDLETCNQTLRCQLAKAEHKIARYERKGSLRLEEENSQIPLKRALTSTLKESAKKYDVLNTPQHDVQYQYRP